MKRFLVAFLVCTAMLLVQTQAQAASKITVIVASSVDTSEQNYMNVTYKKLVELAQKYSDNAFDFQLFPSMQLGDEQETVRALQLGTLQMSMLATNNYAPFAPSCGWVNMPYLFDTLDEFRALLDAMWEQNNEWAVKEGGCRILSILDIGYRQLTTSAKHPVRKLADAKGIKIRTPQNALMVSTFKALGLEPTAVSFSETFNALQQGVVDGQEGCFNNVVTLKFYEAQKYATQINYSVHSANIIASERWLQSLPEKERNALIRAGKEAMLYERTKVADMLATDDKLMQEHGIAVKESRGRLSYCPPGRTKFITAKKLSKKLEKEQVLTALSQNIQLATAIQPSSEQKPDKIRKLVDIQAKVAAGKGVGYERWAKKFNLKSWSQTLLLLQEKGLLSEDALHQRIVELQTQHDDALAVVKDMDARMVSLKELRGHLVVYRQYKPLAQKLQTVRNPAKFKEQHRAEFAVYEAACAYFKANGLRTLPDLKKLDAEYQTLSSEKNGFYTRYKKAQIELRELRTAQQNVEAFFRKEERSHAVPQQEVK